MTESKTDITQSLISTLDINHRIGSIFPDSAILDIQFNIISISQNILEATGYTSSEVKSKPISIFSTTKNFKTLLEEQLAAGYFEEQSFDLNCKGGEKITYSLSGFYMGLIADVNGLIVIKFKNQDELNQANKQLVAKAKELDDFIYSSSHSLRGPLATLKGLINIARVSKNLEEMEFLLTQMDVFADRLDEKLHHLIYVAESDKTPTSNPEEISIQSIFQALSISVHESSIDYPVHFLCPVLDQEQMIEKGESVLSMLKNIVLFFCQQPKKLENVLTLDVLSSSSATEIMIRSKGFQFCDSLIEKIKNVNFGYSEILNFPELINYYAAKKIMLKLNGNVQFMLISSDEVVVLMTIPRDNQLSLF
ncbi:MAG: hypothetical protein ABI663_14030 [Chryseolinea sp.]